MALFSSEILVTFGDCDPAGIVYYPNFLAWMDRTFHLFLLQRVGGHAQLCRDLGCMGLGVMEAGVTFRSPAMEGAILRMSIHEIEWAPKTFSIRYTAEVDGRPVLEGVERRGVFQLVDGRLRASEVAALRPRIEVAAETAMERELG